jgi:CubicO group peptidase (beta-lactamase class C family)
MADRVLLALSLSLSVSFAPAALAQKAAPTAAAAPERVEKDTPRATAAGATYTVPAGWTVDEKAPLVVMRPPEGNLAAVLYDATEKDADAAVAGAWKAYAGGGKWPLKLTTPQAARDGWEERKTYSYETSPNEKKTVVALAYRAGTAWTVLILDAADATLEKRGAPLSLAFASVRPKGYAKESFAGKKPHPVDAAMVASLKAFLSEGMKLYEVPGVGFSLLEGGKPVFEGGLGVRELGKSAPVDADTLFMAASNTKALTTLLLAELVDEKKLRWDEPVTEAYPSFRLGDEATTKQVLVKHLICACTGLPRQDLEWIFEYEKETPESAMKLLGTMQPTSRFGEVFQYSNMMAGAAGFIGGSIAFPGKPLGAAYDQAMQAKVLGPLGMSRTTFDYAKARGDSDVAFPHGDDVDGRTARAPVNINDSVAHLRPAGAVWTTVRDLDKYVAMELAKGVLPGGKRLVSEENLVARRAPQVALGEDAWYGMGLMVSTRYGITLVHHGGDLAGFHSDMFWLPDFGIGGVVYANSDAGVALRGPFLRRLLELLFDGKPEAEAGMRAGAAARKAAIAKERERLVVPPDPEAVAKLAPRYVARGLGPLAVKRDGTKTVFDAGEWWSSVASRKNDDGTMSFLTIDPTLGGFEFVVADKDGRRRLVMRDAQHEYVFEESGKAP